MHGADLVLAWFDPADNSKPLLIDAHAHGRTPDKDHDSQDYTLLGLSQNDGKMSLRFKRRIDTCDGEDFLITRDTASVIYAIGELEGKENIDENVVLSTYHGVNRGVKSLRLLDPGRRAYPVHKARTVEVRLDPNTLVPEKESTYYCKLFQLPSSEKKKHIIAWEPIVTPGNEQLVHHMAVYGCNFHDAEVRQLLEKHKKEHPKGDDCFNKG